MNTTIVGWAVALAPTTPWESSDVVEADPVTEGSFDVASVEITNADTCTHVVALDGAAHFAAAITFCPNEAGRIDVDADYADGLYLSVRYDGDQPMIESNGTREANSRVQLVLDKLDPADVQAGWGACLWATGGVVASVAGGNAPLAVASSFVMFCECAPVVSEAYEGYECPGW